LKPQDQDWKEIINNEYTKKNFLDKFHLSIHEISELGIAWVILCVAIVVINITRGIPIAQLTDSGLFNNFFIFIFVLGISYFTHELMHKFTAIKYGAKAEFKISPQALMFLAISIIIGFPILSVGAVYWWGESTSSIGIRGRVSAAGPISNLILVGIFITVQGIGYLFLENLTDLGLILIVIGETAVWLNLFLGAFNLLPIGILDGAKVLEWSPRVWIGLVGSFLLLGLFIGDFMYYVVNIFGGFSFF